MTPVIWFRTQKNRFKRTFFAGTRTCPHNLNRAHFAGVYSYECPHKSAAVSAHTHAHENPRQVRGSARINVFRVAQFDLRSSFSDYGTRFYTKVVRIQFFPYLSNAISSIICALKIRFLVFRYVSN